MLLQWTEVADLVKDGVLTEAVVGRIFEGLPKEPMGIPSTAVGIGEEAFVSLNNMLDVLLDSKSEKDKSQAAATPLQLISEPPRPMPAKDKELSMGSLGATAAGIDRFVCYCYPRIRRCICDAAPSTEDDSSTGLSGAELELMELLDKADNMLNSGSYGDFDQLIGDLNDPRLAALREKRDGAEEVSIDCRTIYRAFFLCPLNARCLYLRLGSRRVTGNHRGVAHRRPTTRSLRPGQALRRGGGQNSRSRPGGDRKVSQASHGQNGSRDKEAAEWEMEVAVFELRDAGLLQRRHWVCQCLPH